MSARSAGADTEVVHKKPWVSRAGSVFILFGAVVAGAVIMILALDRYQWRAEVRKSPEVQAKITEVHRSSGGKRDRDWVRASFTWADGTTVTAEVKDFVWDPPPQVGDPLKIQYTQRNPYRDGVHDMRETQRPWVSLSWNIAAAVALVGVALFNCLVMWRHWRRYLDQEAEQRLTGGKRSLT